MLQIVETIRNTYILIDHLLHEDSVVFFLKLVVSGSGLHHIPDHLHHLGLVLLVLVLKTLTLRGDLQNQDLNRFSDTEGEGFQVS